MNQYCSGCHNQDDKAGGLALDTLDVEQVGKDAAVWEQVVRKVRSGHDAAQRPATPARVLCWMPLRPNLKLVSIRLRPQARIVGSPVLHRLNRTEYANAIRDLLALDVDVTTLLPSDDSNEGFDNIADALSVSPTLIQGYVSAAMKISRLAVGDRTLIPTQTTYLAPSGLVQDKRLEGLPLGTRGGMMVRTRFRSMRNTNSPSAEAVLAAHAAVAEAEPISRIDGQPVTVRGNRRMPVKAGPHTIAVAVIEGRKAGGVDDQYSDYRVNSQFAVGGGVSTWLLPGPSTPPARATRRAAAAFSFVIRHSCRSEEVSCARKILTTLARRAFRRPLADDAEVDGLMTFYQKGRKEGDFEVGIQQAVARILVAPRFVFRMEDEPANVEGRCRVSGGRPRARVASVVLPVEQHAGRRTARSRQRRQTQGSGTFSSQQVRRMLKDPKSDALVKNFAGQWLYLRDLAGLQPDTKEFDDNLRQAMIKETEMLFDSIVREDRESADAARCRLHVRERTARARTTAFRIFAAITSAGFRCDANSPRRGLLGQGSFLTVTSIANRTSPVLRGKWILQNLLGDSAAGAAAERGSESRCGSESRKSPIRCASGWNSIARSRCARRATRSWIRSDSRWRISI